MSDKEEIEESSEDQASEDELAEDEREKIKLKLSQMSFEDLQQMKHEMGTKLYNTTVFGNVKSPKVSFKRANKNRPREMSSRRPVRSPCIVNCVKKKVPRDPRFEPMCGEFDRKSFKNNYKFINELRKKEKLQLEDSLKTTNNKEDQKKIKFVLQRLNNQIQEEDRKNIESQNKFNQTFSGDPDGQSKPHYKKKSVKKLESLINKFEELKKTNKIQKHIERKSKKIGAKQRRKLERQNLL